MTKDEQLAIQEASRQGHRLTDWEVEFIDSLYTRSEQNPSYELSPKQAARLKVISNKLNVV